MVVQSRLEQAVRGAVRLSFADGETDGPLSNTVGSPIGVPEQ